MTTRKKVDEISTMSNLLTRNERFQSSIYLVSKRLPYGLATDAYTKYADDFSLIWSNENTMKVYGGEPISGKRTERYLRTSANLVSIRKKSCAAPVEVYKVFYPDLWGDTSDKRWLGGTFSDVILGKPGEVCTEKYHSVFPSKDEETAKKASKYLLSRFLRAIISGEKTSSHTPQSAFKNVPVQDFHEDFWNSDDIDYIDECLFDKYGVPEYIREFIRKNIQRRTIDNIENYHTVK